MMGFRICINYVYYKKFSLSYANFWAQVANDQNFIGLQIFSYGSGNQFKDKFGIQKNNN